MCHEVLFSLSLSLFWFGVNPRCQGTLFTRGLCISTLLLINCWSVVASGCVATVVQISTFLERYLTMLIGSATSWGEVCGLCPHPRVFLLFLLRITNQGRSENRDLQTTVLKGKCSTRVSSNVRLPRGKKFSFIKAAQGSRRMTCIPSVVQKASANIEYRPD